MDTNLETCATPPGQQSHTEWCAAKCLMPERSWGPTCSAWVLPRKQAGAPMPQNQTPSSDPLGHEEPGPPVSRQRSSCPALKARRGSP